MSSSALTPRRVESVFWLALLSALVIAIGIESDWGRRWIYPLQQIDVQPAPFSKPTLTEPFRLPPADAFLEIAMRPIFVATRRPAPTVTVEAPKPRMKKDQFTLTGTTIVPDGKFAHLLEKAGNKSYVLSEGKEINGILIKEVRTDRVVLTQHDDTETVMLYVAKAPKVPSQAPQKAPPQVPQQTQPQIPPPPVQVPLLTPPPQIPQQAPTTAQPSQTPGPATPGAARSTTLPMPFGPPKAK